MKVRQTWAEMPLLRLRERDMLGDLLHCPVPEVLIMIVIKFGITNIALVALDRPMAPHLQATLAHAGGSTGRPVVRAPRASPPLGSLSVLVGSFNKQII